MEASKHPSGERKWPFDHCVRDDLSKTVHSIKSIFEEGTSRADPRRLRELPLGSTDAGKKWVVKALHPADHEVAGTQLTTG